MPLPSLRSALPPTGRPRSAWRSRAGRSLKKNSSELNTKRGGKVLKLERAVNGFGSIWRDRWLEVKLGWLQRVTEKRPTGEKLRSPCPSLVPRPPSSAAAGCGALRAEVLPERQVAGLVGERAHGNARLRAYGLPAAGAHHPLCTPGESQHGPRPTLYVRTGGERALDAITKGKMSMRATL